MTDDTTTLAQVKQMITDFKTERGWLREDPKDLALSLVLESAELLEHFQWLSGDEVKNNPKIKQAIGEEMSDVLWWTLNLGQTLGLDVADAFDKKMAKNKQKYPATVFTPGMTQDEKNKEYYKIKAATRGGHPLYEEPKKGDE